MHRDYARYHLRLSRGCGDAQRKALALLCDIAAAGDDGVAIDDLIYGPQRGTPGGKVTDALSQPRGGRGDPPRGGRMAPHTPGRVGGRARARG